MAASERPVLVAGGALDPNLRALRAALERAGRPHLPLLVGPDSHPGISWDLAADVLRLNGAAIQPHAVFVRHDVFANLADRRPASARRARGWFSAVLGWARAHPDVRLFNRHGPHAANKPHALWLAAQCGLPIPKTRITNTLGGVAGFLAGQPRIAKPVAGGSLCRALDEQALGPQAREGVLPTPAIVQQRLVAPEVRVFRIGSQLRAYRVDSDALDYRASKTATVSPVPVPEQVRAGLWALSERLALDWMAADLKTDPQTGELCFLEVNTGPMFARFDQADGGALCDAVVKALCGDDPDINVHHG